MGNSVSAEVADKYINGYFKKKYTVDVSRQPRFWEAVRELSANINADVSSLIDEKADYCIMSVGDYSSVKYLGLGVTTVTEFAKKIAAEIIEEENKTIQPVEVFLLTKRLEEIEITVSYLNARMAIYG